MKNLKKTLTHIFVVMVNFYLLTFAFGLILMLWTVFMGAVNLGTALMTAIIPLFICIVYQITRNKWSITSIGEIIIGNSNKNDIMEQTKLFAITRVPIFILIFLTLIINGNLQDGLSEGKIFSIGSVIMLGLMFWCVYNGLKNFFTYTGMLPISLIATGLFLIGFALKLGSDSPMAGLLMFKIEASLAIIWLITGFIYNKNRITD